MVKTVSCLGILTTIVQMVVIGVIDKFEVEIKSYAITQIILQILSTVTKPSEQYGMLGKF